MLRASFLSLLLLTTDSSLHACADRCSGSARISRWSLVIFGVLALFWVWQRFRQTPAGIALEPDDPAVAAAKAEARESLPVFWQAYNNPDPNEREFILKFNLTPHSDAEFIWATDIAVRGGRIFGRLGNQPLAPEFHAGQEVEIDPDQIVDWSFFRNGVAQGHYLTKIMMPHMPGRAVREAKQQLGWAD